MTRHNFEMPNPLLQGVMIAVDLKRPLMVEK